MKKVYTFVSNNDTVKTMDQHTTKKIVWNKEAINILSVRLHRSKDGIKKIIKGERNPLGAEILKQEYKLICHNLKAIEKTVKLQ